MHVIHYIAASVPGAVVADASSPSNIASGNYAPIIIGALVSGVSAPIIRKEAGRDDIGDWGARLLGFGVGYGVSRFFSQDVYFSMALGVIGAFTAVKLNAPWYDHQTGGKRFGEGERKFTKPVGRLTKDSSNGRLR